MLRIRTHIAACAVALFALASAAMAQTPINDRGPQTLGLSSSSELNMTATVTNAMRVDIETNGGATVNGAVPTTTGVFSVNLGDVNGLGLGTPASGVSKAATTGGYLYSTPIKVTPYFSGLTAAVGGSGNGTLTVQLDATGNSADALLLTREGGTANAMSALTAAPTVVTASAQTGVGVTRHVGFLIPSTNTVTSANLQARIVYRILPAGL